MKLPVEVVFKGLPVSDSVRAEVWKRAEALEHHSGRIIRCRAVIGTPHRRHRQGTLYDVRVDVTVPGADLVVDREHRASHAHEDVFVAVRDAFDAMQRLLEDRSRRRVDARVAT
jgi:ribosome-associated translation inhibitor RaiA